MHPTIIHPKSISLDFESESDCTSVNVANILSSSIAKPVIETEEAEVITVITEEGPTENIEVERKEAKASSGGIVSLVLDIFKNNKKLITINTGKAISESTEFKRIGDSVCIITTTKNIKR